MLEYDPFRRLSYTWHTMTPELAQRVGVSEEVRAKLNAEPRSQVAFDIEPVDDVCKLTVVHEFFADDTTISTMVSEGWPRVIAALKTLPRNRFTARLGPQRDDARSVAPESCRDGTGDGKGGALISYFQAIVIGLLQGVTELFPISSLGHSVLVPAWLGWDHVVSAQSAGESFYLAFVVALHVATALALLVYFRADWVRIIGGFFRTLRTRRLETPDERLAWLLIVATIPAGLTGLALEHSLAHAVRQAARGRDLPHDQRRDPLRR